MTKLAGYAAWLAALLLLASCGSGGSGGKQTAIVASTIASQTPSPTSTAPPVDPIDQCDSVVAGMKAPLHPLNGQDPVLVISRRKLAALPLTLQNPTRSVGVSRVTSVNQYVNSTSVLDPEVWRSSMIADGFTVAEEIGYQAGPDYFGAEALRFPSVAKAADFQRRTLTATCNAGVVDGMKQIPALPGSFLFARSDTGPPFRASLVIGPNVVHLNLCECVETVDPIGLLGRWAIRVAVQLGVRS